MEKNIMRKLKEYEQGLQQTSSELQELEARRENTIAQMHELRGRYSAYYDLAVEAGLVEGQTILPKGAEILAEIEDENEENVEHVVAEEVTAE